MHLKPCPRDNGNEYKTIGRENNLNFVVVVVAGSDMS